MDGLGGQESMSKGPEPMPETEIGSGLNKIL